MRFIKISNDRAVNPHSVDYISNKDGFGHVHIGIEILATQLPYESLLNLMAIGSSEMGNCPNYTATALTY